MYMSGHDIDLVSAPAFTSNHSGIPNASSPRGTESAGNDREGDRLPPGARFSRLAILPLEAWPGRRIRDFRSDPVGQTNHLLHLREVQRLNRVRGLVIAGMKAPESHTAGTFATRNGRRSQRKSALSMWSRSNLVSSTSPTVRFSRSRWPAGPGYI